MSQVCFFLHTTSLNAGCAKHIADSPPNSTFLIHSYRCFHSFYGFYSDLPTISFACACYCACCVPPGDPNKDPKILSDPFKTLFVGRIVSSFVQSLCSMEMQPILSA